MKVMITGSRIWENKEIIYKELDKLPRDSIIVHGGARGADTIAGNYANKIGLESIVYIPDWQKYGKSAGIIRNNTMLDSGIDLVLAFMVNGSSGTKHSIEGAENRGIPFILHEDDYQ